MKIKTKLRLGFGFLFLVVLFFGAISLFYMNQISLSSKVILKDNYETLSYTSKMRAVLDEQPLPLSGATREEFERYMAMEGKNITEKGEGAAVSALGQAYQAMMLPGATEGQVHQAVTALRAELRKIDQLNMAAIVRKNDAAQKAVEKAALYVIFTASICFLILFSFIVNFPGFVANPLKEFSEAIREISRKNYKQRLEFNGSDEFSELAHSFNTMAQELNKWENSNLSKIQSEKLRIEAIIEQMQDAIIGLNEKKEFLFLIK